MTMTVAKARSLTIAYGEIVALRGVSCEVCAGEILGIAGDSGTGKSTLLGALHGHLPREARIVDGAVERFARTAQIDQEPRMTFSPYLRIEEHLEHVARETGTGALEGALERVGLKAAKRMLRAYPHEVSGGELQRVAWAQALLMRPAAILADEPTSSLDCVAQREVAMMAVALCREQRLGLVWVSHQAGLLRAICDRVLELKPC